MPWSFSMAFFFLFFSVLILLSEIPHFREASDNVIQFSIHIPHKTKGTIEHRNSTLPPLSYSQMSCDVPAILLLCCKYHPLVNYNPQTEQYQCFPSVTNIYNPLIIADQMLLYILLGNISYSFRKTPIHIIFQRKHYALFIIPNLYNYLPNSPL